MLSASTSFYCDMITLLFLTENRDIDVTRGIGLNILNQCIGIGAYPIQVVVECRIIEQTTYTAMVAGQCS